MTLCRGDGTHTNTGLIVPATPAPSGSRRQTSMDAASSVRNHRTSMGGTTMATSSADQQSNAPSPEGTTKPPRRSRTNRKPSGPTTAGTTVSNDIVEVAAKDLPIMDKVTGYLDGAIDTLGASAAEGNSVAAKAIVDLWSTLKQQELGEQTNAHLEQIAKIREQRTQP